ncbi:unnamed protein product [Penicillium salamii]|uniref:Methyltransferase domain-containing protein n=1 Tax=Penicillium salamii TaxID=1612424 RepID=A0A9W4K1J3_9EURO|nr:unnamed protein product [Penicillium salamii]CAG7976276.1 unnamed protein product [Penicillium salamii]CAG7999543.1 unnamed protein product [Penicillium salamii]CAG8194511.1 unnamed protein product [Penicillium salamii]CAG8257113.1 unnamed protein product [Penicillium salamii]
MGCWTLYPHRIFNQTIRYTIYDILSANSIKPHATKPKQQSNIFHFHNPKLPKPINKMLAPNTVNELYLGQARASGSTKDCMALYDRWAETYDDEVTDEAQNYVAPVLVAQAAIRYGLSGSGATNSIILDAGCGTGLVGVALGLAKAKAIDGIDLSEPMLNVARRTGVYRDLSVADMNAPISKDDETYDVVSCVGTFTLGHVGPDPALRELVRVAKTGGIVVSTILEEIWVSGGFQAEVEKLKREGLVEVVTEELIDYVKGHGDKAVLLILEKIDRV